MPPRLVLLALLACLLWASGAPVIKLCLQDAPPLGLAAVRMALSAMILWPWLAALAPPARRPWPPPPPQTAPAALWRVVFPCLLCYAVLEVCMYEGFARTTASSGVVLLNTTPLWVAVLARFVPPIEPLGPRKAAGLTAAFAGVCLVIAGIPQDSATAGSHSWRGDALMLCAAFAWALQTLASRAALPRIDADRLMSLQFAAGAFLLALLAGAFEPLSAWHASPRLGIGLLYLATLGTALPWMLWMKLLREAPAGMASAFLFTVPPLGVALAVVFLGEIVTPWFLAGALLVTAGIAAATWRPPFRPAASSSADRA